MYGNGYFKTFSELFDIALRKNGFYGEGGMYGNRYFKNISLAF